MSLINLLIFCFLFQQSFSANYGTLYGIAPSVSQLEVIDKETGKTTPLGSPLPNEIDSQGVTAIDYINKIFYLIAWDDASDTTALYGFDLNNGDVSIKVPLPFAEGVFVGVGQTLDVDPITGDVFVVGRLPKADNLHHIYRVTPKSGNLAPVAEIGEIDLIGGISFYDPKNKIYWIEYATNTSVNYYGVNVTSGKLYNTVENTANLETSTWDPATGLFYGIGLRPINATNFVRTVVTFDSKTSKFNEIAVIPDYSVILGSGGAFDWNKRICYAYMQKSGNEKNPFNLVGVDARSGKVVSEPFGCDTVTLDCPWALEMFNKPWH